MDAVSLTPFEGHTMNATGLMGMFAATTVRVSSETGDGDRGASQKLFDLVRPQRQAGTVSDSEDIDVCAMRFKQDAERSV